MSLTTEMESELSLREPMIRLAKDVKKAASTLSAKEAHWLVDTYYMLQKDRIRAAHQERQCRLQAEPNQLIHWTFDAMKRLENAIKGALGMFAARYRVGQWLQAQTGIGPVLSAASLTYFDIRRAPAMGHFWSFAGLSPDKKWLGKEAAKKLLTTLGVDKTLTAAQAQAIAKESGYKADRIYRWWNGGATWGKKKAKAGMPGLILGLSIRPYCASLKSIMVFRLGETMVKFQNHNDCFYGRLFAEKKAELWNANLAGDFAAVAEAEAARHDKFTEAYKWKSGRFSPRAVQNAFAAGESPTTVEEGEVDGITCLPMLPPGQIHNRARRWMAKLFIGHLWEVMYRDHYGTEPPDPYIFAHPVNGQHVHRIAPPLWPGNYDGQPIAELLKSEKH